MSNPTPDQIRAVRLAVGLSQAEAGEVILSSKRSWENWEQGRVKMHPGLFDYFLIKTDQKHHDSIPQK
jgi:DNA-binding transcriptional regulator YiaG